MKISEKTKCKVPFGTMSVEPEAIQLINTMLANKMLTNGKCVQEFENQFAQAFQQNYAVAVSSGTDAVTLALATLHDFGVPRGAKVIVPALTFIATANAVLNAGFQPKFIDVDRNTLNMNPYELEEAIDGETRAILVVHLMGNPAAMDKIKEIADKYDLFLIEDCAEAHGAMIGHKYVGSWGIMACYSLYAAHIVSSIEGGMITTNHIECDKILRSLRNHGMEMQGSNWTFERVGYSAKMNELEAAIGLYNLKYHGAIKMKRRINMLHLMREFKEKELDKYFLILEEKPNTQISAHAFSIILKPKCPFTKAEFVKHLSDRGIDNRNLFYSIPTQCEAYKKYASNIYPEAEYCSNNGTHIGVHQDLTLSQLEYVIKSIQEFIYEKT